MREFKTNHKILINPFFGMTSAIIGLLINVSYGVF
jgi:hypothetical protein